MHAPDAAPASSALLEALEGSRLMGHNTRDKGKGMDKDKGKDKGKGMDKGKGKGKAARQ
jgi:hypothetical protein